MFVRRTTETTARNSATSLRNKGPLIWRQPVACASRANVVAAHPVIRSPRRRIVARIERSEMRERRCRGWVSPGFRCAQFGLQACSFDHLVGEGDELE